MGSLCCHLCCCCCRWESSKSKDSSNTMRKGRKGRKRSYSDNDYTISATSEKTVTGLSVNKSFKRKFVTKAEQMGFLDKTTVREHKVILSFPYNHFTKICNNLYLTGVGGMIEENIAHYKIGCVVQITYELPRYNIPGIQCIRVSAEDSESEDLSPYFDKISDKINEMIENNIKTVVHCMAGIRRSVTIVIAFLMKYKKMCLKEAFIYVKARRHAINSVNPSFFRQLIEYENKLFSKTSVEMIKSMDSRGQKKLIPDFFVTEYPELADLPSDSSPVSSLETSADKVSSITSFISLTSDTYDSKN